MVALPLAFAGRAAGAPAKAERPAAAKPPAPPEAAPSTTQGIADELRVLRAEVESMRQRPDGSVSGEMAALRAEVAKLAAAQADLERRLGGAAGGGPPAEGAGGTGLGSAVLYLALGLALGWVANQLTHRWRDRRQRIRL